MRFEVEIKMLIPSMHIQFNHHSKNKTYDVYIHTRSHHGQITIIYIVYTNTLNEDRVYCIYRVGIAQVDNVSS